MGASVQRMPAVSRPAWMLTLSGFADRGGSPRRSPVEIVATMGSYLRTIHQAAAARGLPVAEVSAHFLPPWSGKFASDCFHPSQDGYRDWARALLATVPLLAAAA